MTTINEHYAKLREVELKQAAPTVERPDLNAGMKKIQTDQQGVVINHVTVRPINRQTQDIQKWRNALIAAEQGHQQRSLLYDLYEEILLDGRLKQLINQRIARITNTPMTFMVDGKVDKTIKQLSRKKYFRKFLFHALMSRFWGHSLMELLWPAPGSTDKGVTNLIPRKHVKPKYGLVTKLPWDTEGINYRKPPLINNCIEVGEPDDLGLILEACPHVIFKRGGFGDWAEFAEVFGMPFRWATYQNEQSRLILESALSEAGAAGYVVAPEGANLQFHNPTAGSSSNDIFRFLINACNEELSITILGNTMTTTDSKHGGYAQSETQMKTQDELHKDDREFILSILNEDLKEYLVRLGYKIGEGEWSFEDGDGIPLTQRIAIDTQVANIVPIAEDYWYDKYLLPRPEAGEEIEDDVDDDDMEEDSPPPPKKVQGKKP